MGNKIQKQENQALEKKSKPNLINALEKGNKQEINIVLRDFKTKNGTLNFVSILSIPRTLRIPALNEQNPGRLLMLIVGALTVSFESMNLKRPMTAAQIIDLADNIVDSASEDYLSIEDLMLFLQKLIRGDYGSNYESMDIPKFMEKFEIYREERHQELMKIKDSQHSQYKILGDTGKSNQIDELGLHFSGMAEKISVMNSELKHQRNLNRNLQDENKNLKNNIPKQ